VGFATGSAISSGAKNTIIGGYNGNQGGLDIRTSSNIVVLSDGDGNPVISYGTLPNGASSFTTNSGITTLGIGGTSSTNTGFLALNGSTTAGYGPCVAGYGNGSLNWQVASLSQINGSSTTYLAARNSTGGVYLNGSSATSWTAISDERVKENLEPISDALNKVSTLRAVIGNYTFDENKKRTPFLIAQDVQAVLPEAVGSNRNSKDDETEYLGVSYTEVIPLLVASIKELKSIVDAQATRIAILEAK